MYSKENMKIITAKQFAQHASGIGKYLNANPRDYYFVSNKTDPKKNFICCTGEFLWWLNPEQLNEVELLTQRFTKERAVKSREMSKKHWDNVKMRRDYDEKPLEKIRTLICNDNRITSIADFHTSIKDMENRRGRGAGLVHTISGQRPRTYTNQSVCSIL